MTTFNDRIVEIAQWDRGKCLEAWAAMIGAPPKARLSTKFLRRALIFEAQCKELGGHSAATKRALKANAFAKGDRVAKPAIARAAGTQLVREWNGRIYRVDVSQNGYQMDGRSFSSLSAVAKHITVAQWSGPRFFGVNGNSA